MRIVIRTVAFAALLAAYFGLVEALPDSSGVATVGLVAFITVVVAIFLWARHDGREFGLADGLRDWLVVAFVIGVLWWLALLYSEGSHEVVEQFRENVGSVGLTIAMLFAPAALGVMLGNGARPVWDDGPTDRSR